MRPCQGEVVCGDGIVVLPLPGEGVLLGMIDVLGHGREAAQLARHIESWLKQHASTDLLGMLAGLHKELRGSRGSAVTLARLAPDGLLEWVGVGNTMLRKINTTTTTCFAQPGTVGEILRTPRIQSLQVLARDVLLLNSDGIAEHLPMESLLTIAQLPIAQMAKEVLARFGKPHDDCACLLLRILP